MVGPVRAVRVGLGQDQTRIGMPGGSAAAYAARQFGCRNVGGHGGGRGDGAGCSSGGELSIDPNHAARHIEYLEHVRRRPAMDIGSVEVEPAVCWLDGFQGAWMTLLGQGSDFRSLEFDARKHAAQSRGWEWSAQAFVEGNGRARTRARYGCGRVTRPRV